MSEKIVPIVMPKWGLSMREGSLAEWHVEEGQRIAPGQPIMDVETDKIANVVEAADGGLLRRRVGLEGQVYPVKALLGVMAPVEVSDREIEAYIAEFDVPSADAIEPTEVPTHQFTQTPSGRLRYAHRSGDGDPILLLHGFGGDIDTWLFNIDELAQAGPVYALDLPGHGGSTKVMAASGLPALVDAVEQFAAAHGLRGMHVVGHSMGGAVAGSFALRTGDLVRSLTLIDAAGLGPDINGAYIDGFVAATTRRELTPIVRLLFANADLVNRTLVADLLKYKRLDGVTEALSGLANAMFHNGQQTTVLADQLETLPMPIHVVWGANDAIVPVAHARAIPSADVHVLDDVGHMPQLEAASKLNALVCAHARR